MFLIGLARIKDSAPWLPVDGINSIKLHDRMITFREKE
jgi:hypothetical protein